MSINRTKVIPLHVPTNEGSEPNMDQAILLQVIWLIAHNPQVQKGNTQTYNGPHSYRPVRPSTIPYTRYLCVVSILKMKDIFWFI